MGSLQFTEVRFVRLHQSGMVTVSVCEAAKLPSGLIMGCFEAAERGPLRLYSA